VAAHPSGVEVELVLGAPSADAPNTLRAPDRTVIELQQRGGSGVQTRQPGRPLSAPGALGDS